MATGRIRKTVFLFTGLCLALFFLFAAFYTTALAADPALYASITPGKGLAVPLRPSSVPLASGRFLVARGTMRDPFFSRTVIYLIDYNPMLGTFGVVVNHPTKTKIFEALPHLEWLKDSPLALSWGGPVERLRLTILALSKAPVIGAAHVTGNVYAGWEIELFRDFFQKGAGEINAIRAYGGYAGWAPGQLEAEVRRGGWRVVKADETLIFKDTSKLWFKLMGGP